MSHRDDYKLKPSDAEIFRLLEEANDQYDEYVKLLETPDLPVDPGEVPLRRYSWDNPTGIVIKDMRMSTSLKFHA